jgi:hypothetical protein
MRSRPAFRTAIDPVVDASDVIVIYAIVVHGRELKSS